MRHVLSLAIVLLVSAACLAADKPKEEGWISLFDGRTLDGWKESGAPGSFTVEDGILVAKGKPMGHLFYQGDVEGHDFKNFEVKVEAMTLPGSNGGIYFHTKYQDKGWPRQGFEVQVNNTHRDPIKTGSIYQVRNVTESPAKDNEWFTVHITVRGKQVTVMVDDKKVVDFEVERSHATKDFKRELSSGTFALQAHDPKSEVRIRSIQVKPLAD